jgi:hypothetical protein
LPTNIEDHGGDRQGRTRRSSHQRRAVVVVHSATPAPRVAQQVGDQVDRAGGEHDAVLARELARARERGVRVGSPTSPAPPIWPASEASVAAGSARGLVQAVQTTRVAVCEQPREHPAASLSSRIETTATRRRPPRTPAATAPAPRSRRRCARRRSSVTAGRRPAPRSVPAPRAPPTSATRSRSSSRPRNARAAVQRGGEVAPLVAAARAKLDRPASSAARTAWPRARAAVSQASSSASGSSPAPTTSVAPGARRRASRARCRRPSGRGSACARARRWSAPRRANRPTLVAS